MYTHYAFTVRLTNPEQRVLGQGTLGADAMSLLLNALAIDLILRLDNLLLAGALSQSTYDKVATDFRMELDQRRISEACSQRHLHILGPTIMIPLYIYLLNQQEADFYAFYRCLV